MYIESVGLPCSKIARFATIARAYRQIVLGGNVRPDLGSRGEWVRPRRNQRSNQFPNYSDA